MGLWEIALIGMVALMLFSPKELPGIIKAIARGYGALRRTAEEFRAQVLDDEELSEIRDAYHGTRNELIQAQQSARRELSKARVEARLAQQKIESALRAERRLGQALEKAPEAEALPEGSSNKTPNSDANDKTPNGDANDANGDAEASEQPSSGGTRLTIRAAPEPAKPLPKRPSGVVKQGEAAEAPSSSPVA
ncbi:MAG: Sec-independent protein translocase subunit TatA/TatB [Nannocystaceae bacterium]